MNTISKAGPAKVVFFLTLLILIGIPEWSLAGDGDKLWNSDGVAVSTAFSDQQQVCLTGDGSGGAIIAWQDRRTGEDDIYAQRVDSNGDTLWTANGVGIAVAAGKQLDPQIVMDGQGGAIITWWDQDETDTSLPWRVFAQRLNSNGVPQWGVDGVQVSTDVGITPTFSPLNPLSIAADTAAGAFITFEAVFGPRIIHIAADGTLFAPGIDGISLGEGVLTTGGPVVASDGVGGAIVAWANNAKNIVVQRVAADLSLPWGTTPIVVSNDPRRESRPNIVAGDADGVLVTWVRQPELGDPPGAQVMVQKISGEGNTIWTSGGVILVDSEIVGGSTYAWQTYEVAPDVSSDGQGGAIIAWNDWRNETGTGGNDDVFAQLVNADGTIQWTENGISLAEYPGGSQRRPRIAGNWTGGAVVVFQDMGLGSWDIYAVGLDESGITWRNYVYYGGDIPSTGDQTDPVIFLDGTGPTPKGAIIAWDDERGSHSDIYAQKLEVSINEQLPDLVVDSIVFNPAVPNPGQPFTVVITARNQGDADTGSGFSIGLNGLQSALLMDTCSCSAVDAGGTGSCSISYADGKDAGSYPVTACVDCNPQVIWDNVIEESDEQNNSMDDTLIVAQSELPDLVVDSIVFNPAVPSPGQAFTVVITASNQGDADTGSGFSIGLNGLQSALLMDTCSCSAVDAGGTGSCSISYADGKDAGSYPVTACVDCNPQVIWDNVIEESDEQNNSMDDTLIVAEPDHDPPQPDPMTWATPPHGTSTTEASMTASVATDASPPVEYQFVCLSAGCNASDWQSSTTYTDTGLAPNTWYGWAVRAKDSSIYHNMTDYSSTGYDYTEIETPSGIVFDLHDTGSTYLMVKVAETLSNLAEGMSGLIIYNITTNTDSGWKQDNGWWKSNYLSPNTQYQFQAKARNGSGRETPLTSVSMLFTDAAQPGTAPFSAVTDSSITVNWTANGNPGGCNTEYYCENTTTLTNSGWVVELSWTDTGLDCASSYSYRVKARNAQGRETEWTDLGSRITQPCSDNFPWCMFLPAIVEDGSR